MESPKHIFRLRTWPRSVSIRTVLVLQVAIALCAFRVAYTAREQQRIVKAIQTAGGCVHRDEPEAPFNYGYPSPDPRDIWWRRWIRTYAGDDFLWNVNVVGITSDTDLNHFPWNELSRLPRLVRVMMYLTHHTVSQRWRPCPIFAASRDPRSEIGSEGRPLQVGPAG